MSICSTPVIVNFNITLNADSVVTIFGETQPDISAAIVSKVKLPVNALYDISGAGLIEFWEPDASEDIIYAALADASYGDVDLTGFSLESAKRLTRGFQRILCGRFDCSAVAPFSESKYAGIEEYQCQRDFARVALGSIAHKLFGHVDATAAITNDSTFIKNMLSVDAGDSDEYAGEAVDADAAGVVARYNAWRIKNSLPADPAAEVTGVGSGDAKLAQRLVQAIFAKAPAAGQYQVVNSADSSQLAHIAKQVLGQDASRTQTYDNSERTVNKRTLLKFIKGDKIYVDIVVNKPTLTQTNQGNSTNISQKFNAAVNAQTFTIEIELTDAAEYVKTA